MWEFDPERPQKPHSDKTSRAESRNMRKGTRIVHFGLRPPISPRSSIVFCFGLQTVSKRSYLSQEFFCRGYFKTTFVVI